MSRFDPLHHDPHYTFTAGLAEITAVACVASFFSAKSKSQALVTDHWSRG